MTLANGGGRATADVDTAVAHARGAQPGWSRLSLRERGRALRKLAALARADEELAQLIQAETGKPLFEAIGFEIAYLCEVTRFLSGPGGRRALGESRRSSLIFPFKRARVTWQPRGVVAVIGPWNFPLLNNFGDAVAPLMAGNSVLLKPSPHTPRTSRRMQALWKETGLPDGVFQVVEGGAETGQALVDTCDMVLFTGSLVAGRLVAARAGERLIPCLAELGGKSAMIVLADADLHAAARAAAWGAFAGAGQVCIRVERAVVEESVADEFARRVVAETEKLRLGRDGDVDVGRSCCKPKSIAAKRSWQMRWLAARESSSAGKDDGICPACSSPPRCWIGSRPRQPSRAKRPLVPFCPLYVWPTRRKRYA